MSSRCNICPRNCIVDRKTERGFCHEYGDIRAARASLHMWEEPCISGSRGSGTIFFSGCNLRCVFCQNSVISTGEVGKVISSDRLAEIFFELKDEGANNINLVTPSHFVPQIRMAVETAKTQGLDIPFVYNCGGYESVESLKSLEGLIDIYLPDFKYVNNELAMRYSNAHNYCEIAKAALHEMCRQVGRPLFVDEKTHSVQIDAVRYQEVCDDDIYIMTRGVMVRHMILPGHSDDSCDVIRYLLDTYGDKIFISIMSQYTPMVGIEEKYPELSRTLTATEYDKVVNFAIDYGIENGFIQEGEAAKDSFIPIFDCRGI